MKALSPFTLHKFKVIEAATSTTIKVSAEDAAKLKKYCDNFSNPIITVAVESVIATGSDTYKTPYYEEFKVSGIDTNTGVITVDGELHGYDSYNDEKTYVIVNKVVDGLQEEYQDNNVEVVGNALSLNGSSQYAKHDATDELDVGGEDVLVSAWSTIYETPTNYPRIFEIKTCSGNGRYAAFYNPSSRLDVNVSDGSTVIHAYINDLIDGNPHNIVSIFDVGGEIYVFVDGLYKDSSADISSLSITDGDGTTYIGTEPTDSQKLDGVLDDIHILRFGEGEDGLYVTGTGGTDLEIRVGSATGDIIYSEVSPYSPSHPGGLIPAMYRNPGASLSELGYGGLENAERSDISQNGDLEDGTTTNWSTGGTNTIDIETTTVHSGSYSLKATYSDVLKMASNSPSTSLQDGKWREISCWVYVPSGWDGGDIVLNLDPSASNIYYKQYWKSGVSATDTWTELITLFKDESSSAVLLRVRAQSAPSSGKYIYIDDMTCRRIGEVAHWAMNESGTPNTLADSTANHLDLTTVGSPSMVKATIPAWRTKNLTVYKDMTESIQGTQSLYAEATDDDASAEYIFHIPQNTDHTLTLWYKLNNGQISISCDDTNGHVFYENLAITSTSGWQRVDFVVSSDSPSPGISLRIHGITNGTMFWIDAVMGVGSIVKNGSFELGTTFWEPVGTAAVATDADAFSGNKALVITGADDADNNYVLMYADGVQGEQYALNLAGKVDHGKGYVDVYDVSEDIIINGGFENWASDIDVLGWSENNVVSGTREIFKENNVVHSGHSSIKFKLTNNPGPGGAYIHQALSKNIIYEGDYFEWSIWSYYKSKENGYWGIHIDDSSNNRDYIIHNSSTQESGWTLHYGVYKATHNELSCVIYTSGTNEEIYIDDFYIRKIKYPIQYHNMQLDSTSYSRKSIIIPAKLGSFGIKAYHDSGTTFHLDDVSLTPLEDVTPTTESPTAIDGMLTGNGLLIRGDKLYYDIEKLYQNNIFILRYKPLYDSSSYPQQSYLLYADGLLNITVTGNVFTLTVTVNDGSTKTATITADYSRLDAIELYTQLAYGSNEDEVVFKVIINNVTHQATNITSWSRPDSSSDKLYVMSNDEHEDAMPAYLGALMVGDENYIRAVDTTAPDISEISPVADGYRTKIVINFDDPINMVGAQYRLWRGPIAYTNIKSLGSGSKLYLQSSRASMSGNYYSPKFQPGKLVNLYVYSPDDGVVAKITGNDSDGTGEYITYSDNTGSFVAGKNIMIGGLKVAMVKEKTATGLIISNGAASDSLSFYRFNVGDYVVIKNRNGDVVAGPMTIATIDSDVITLNGDISAVHAGDTILYFHNTLNRVCAENVISLPSTKQTNDKIYYTDLLSSVIGTIPDYIQAIDLSLRNQDNQVQANVYRLRTADDSTIQFTTDIYRIGYAVQAVDRYGNASPGTEPVAVDPNKPHIYSDSRNDDDVFNDNAISLKSIATNWIKEIQ